MTTSAVFEPGGWNLEINQAACLHGHANKQRGAFVGNGKIAMLSEFVGGGLQQCMIAGEFKTNKGVYKSNTVETFRTSHWRPFSANPTHVTITPILQRLNMKTGILTSENLFTDVRTLSKVTVSSDIFAARQFPYCTVQTLRISSDTPADVIFFHDVSANDKMAGVEFAYNVIDVDAASSSSMPLSMLTGRGVNDGLQVCFASAILFEDATAGHQLLGYNVYKDVENKSYVKVSVKCVPGIQTRLHCLTIHMTNFDFEDPYDECKMILLSIMNRPALLSLNTIQRLREDHVSQWASLWKSDIVIKPRTGAFVLSPQESKQLNRIQRKLRQDMYMIFSCTRENIEIEVNPGTFGIIDANNDTMYDGDLFLMPLLMFVMPTAVKSLLEYRYKQLSYAVQLAASYGYAGAKFPYNNDVMGYRNALYWDSMAPMYLFNNALIAINAWNYYRITIDKEWLQNKGYSIMKSCVEFFVSRCSVDDKGIYHLNDVMAYNRRSSNDNSFTNNLVKLATRYLVEASYELGYAVKSEWHGILHKLPTNIARAGLETYEIVLYDGNSTPDGVLDDMFDILEPLLVLTPTMSDMYFAPGSGRGFDSLKRNVEFYTKRVSPRYVEHPLNQTIEMLVYGTMNKYNAEKVPDMLACIERMCEIDTLSVWGQELNTTIAAMMPLAILNAVAGINIHGGVSESRFYYEEMTIKGLYASNMPYYWDHVIVSNCGPMRKALVVYNQNM